MENICQAFPQGARVVFIGDSITATVDYPARIAAYYQAHFPERRVSFHGAGVSGGTLKSIETYYDAYIKSFCPTHATVMLGVNDSNRVALWCEDEEQRRKQLKEAFDLYDSRLHALLDRLQADDIAVTLCTPVPYAEFQKTVEEPFPGGYALMSYYAEHLREIAKKRDLPLIDVHADLSERYLKEVIFCDDHVHPNEFGQYRLAACYLRAQGLEPDPFCDLADTLSRFPLIEEWQKIAYIVSTLYSVEWLIVGNFDLPIEEKIAFVQETIDQNKWANAKYFQDITAIYVNYKRSEADLVKRIRQIWQELHDQV